MGTMHISSHEDVKRNLRINMIAQVLVISLSVALFISIPLTGRYEFFAIIIFLSVVKYWLITWRKKLKADAHKKLE